MSLLSACQEEADSREMCRHDEPWWPVGQLPGTYVPTCPTLILAPCLPMDRQSEKSTSYA